jgi:hypothetical protein
VLEVAKPVKGSGIWELTTHIDAMIHIASPCKSLTGVVKLEKGTLKVDADFVTTGKLLMKSDDSGSPLIDVGPNTIVSFDN